MRALVVRCWLWALGAAAAGILAVAVWRAAQAPGEAARDLLVAALGEGGLVLAGVVAWSLRAAASPAAHTRARWAVLDALARVALALVVGFAILMALVVALGRPLGEPLVQLALLAPIIATTTALVGLACEHEPARASRGPRVVRKLYETKTGAVSVVDRGHGPEIVLTHRGGDAGLGAIEKAIDERGWRDGEEPAPQDLRGALERWGQLSGRNDL